MPWTLASTTALAKPDEELGVTLRGRDGKHAAEKEPSMSNLIVHHLAGAWGLPSVSPFCLKLDAYLRLAGVEHQYRLSA